MIRSSCTVAITDGVSNTRWGSSVVPVSNDATRPDFNPAVWNNG